jgi:hypothetical protein
MVLTEATQMLRLGKQRIQLLANDRRFLLHHSRHSYLGGSGLF